MALLDIRHSFKSPEIDRIRFDDSNDFLSWSLGSVYFHSNVGVVPLVGWNDFDNLIMALKKAKELHKLQQKGGEK